MNASEVIKDKKQLMEDLNIDKSGDKWIHHIIYNYYISS